MTESFPERLTSHLRGRIHDLDMLGKLINCVDPADLDADAKDAIEPLLGAGFLELDGNRISAEATDTMEGYALGISAVTVFTINLGTNGPGDWFEVECIPASESQITNTRGYVAEGGYLIESIYYCFADMGGMEREALEGQDLAIAEDYAERVIPELAE